MCLQMPLFAKVHTAVSSCKSEAGSLGLAVCTQDTEKEGRENRRGSEYFPNTAESTCGLNRYRGSYGRDRSQSNPFSLFLVPSSSVKTHIGVVTGWLQFYVLLF